MEKAEKTIRNLLKSADINVNGNRPWDIKVHNPKLFSRVLSKGSLALGESYMDGWWDVKKLDEFFFKILSAKLDRKVINIPLVVKEVIISKILNMQTKGKSKKTVEYHYDIGNDLYSKMLDKRMNYSCAYWKNAKTLDKAQEAKLDLICKKVGLKPGMKVLDIGCGWGGFLEYAARKYKINGVGITLSKEQAKIAKEKCKNLPVEIRIQDYRNLDEKFDRIISIGMIEHVGYKNYRNFMKIAHNSLRDDGLFLLHTIGSNKSVYRTDEWISKYIFPRSMLPSAKQITSAYEKLFVLEDWHSFGQDYDKTLMAWHKNFTKNWDKIKDKYDERFYRMWNYYLLACAGSFRARKNQLWQIVFSKKGVIGGYNNIR